MPIAQIQILEGRTDEQKSAVIGLVTAALVEALGVPTDAVRVLITDVPKTHWGIGGKSVKQLGR